MTGMNRLPAPAGSLLDRSKTIAFQFEGRTYEGFAGDTVASALAANDVWILSRSFKYHRPRGILTMAGLDANTLVQVGDEPNVLADRRAISEGTRRRRPELRRQPRARQRDLDRDVRPFPAAGLLLQGLLSTEGRLEILGAVHPQARRPRQGRTRRPITATYDKEYLFADVAVIGGGPAGVAAALQAADAGAEVIVVDDGAQLGGSLTYARFDSSGRSGRALAEEAAQAVAARSNIRVPVGCRLHRLASPTTGCAVIRGNRMYKLRAKASVIATGALEQPAVFRNNDLPGVMLGSAAQRLIRHYGVRPGRAAVVVTANADGYAVAADLVEAGRGRQRGRRSAHRTREPSPMSRRRSDSICASSQVALSSRRSPPSGSAAFRPRWSPR